SCGDKQWQYAVDETVCAIKKHKALYFVTYAGCGALLSKKILKARPVAFKDLGPEAIYELEIKDFPAIVGIDTHGKSIYKP
ncbi:fumarate hydratase C-terminal domain-containing protein, partial [Candidatus Omnitrophota bacterium]